MEQILREEESTNDLLNLRPILCERANTWHHWWYSAMNLTWMSPERLHPATNKGRYKDPQLTIRRSPGNLVEEWGIEMSLSEVTNQGPQDDAESTNMGPWELKEPGPPTGKHIAAGHRTLLNICSKSAALSSCGSLIRKVRTVLVSVPCHWNTLPTYLDCLVEPHWERICLDFLGLDAPSGKEVERAIRSRN